MNNDTSEHHPFFFVCFLCIHDEFELFESIKLHPTSTDWHVVTIWYSTLMLLIIFGGSGSESLEDMAKILGVDLKERGAGLNELPKANSYGLIKTTNEENLHCNKFSLFKIIIIQRNLVRSILKALWLLAAI